MTSEKCCITCKYCVSDEDGKMFCENMLSEDWFEEISEGHRCWCWEEKDE